MVQRLYLQPSRRTGHGRVPVAYVGLRICCDVCNFRHKPCGYASRRRRNSTSRRQRRRRDAALPDLCADLRRRSRAVFICWRAGDWTILPGKRSDHPAFTRNGSKYAFSCHVLRARRLFYGRRPCRQIGGVPDSRTVFKNHTVYHRAYISDYG